MTRRRVLLALLLLLSFPLPQAVASSTAEPAEEGAWTLRFALDLPEPRRATLSLDVAREDADGVARGVRALGVADLPAGPSVREVTFLPAEGAGAYDVALLADGERIARVAFDVADEGASARLTYEVPDEPTRLNLTRDDVNDDNKTKSPGEAVITRALLSDGNGVGDVDGVVWRLEREGAFVDSGLVAFDAAATNTSAPLEHRLARSPFAAGSYRLALHAIQRGAVVATASRAFAIRDVATTLAAGELRAVVPDAAGAQETAIVFADRNGAPAGPLEARVYRGSARVEGAGFSATLGAPRPLADDAGAGRAAAPLTLGWPARAAPGAYRVNVYANGTLAGSIPFEVRALPALASVAARDEGGALRLDARGAGNGTLMARLDDGAGNVTRASAAFAEGNGSLVLPAPRRGAPLAWTLSVQARPDGAVVDERNGTWTAPADGAPVRLVAIHARGRLPSAWRVDTDGPLEGARAEVTVRRWDGRAEPNVTARLSGDRVRVEGPAGLEAGRYDARMVLTWPNGSASETSWSFEAGPTTRVALGEPRLENGTLVVTVRNEGARTITRLVVETEPAAAQVRWQSGGAAAFAPATRGRATLTSLSLAPGEEGVLSFALPSGPQRSGAHEAALRVLVPVGA